jgi:RNA polymerase sigma-70 factor (ECF subfamily)
MEKEEIVSEYLKVQNTVKAYALSICADFHIAEDICQEVVLKLMKRASSYDSSRPFLPWALNITRCETVDYLNKHNRKNALVLNNDLAELMAETYLEISKEQRIEERTLALRHCLQKLNSQNFEIFRLKYVKKQSMKQLAAKYSRSFLSIQSLLNRLREKLRRCIKVQLEASK